LSPCTTLFRSRFHSFEVIFCCYFLFFFFFFFTWSRTDHILDRRQLICFDMWHNRPQCVLSVYLAFLVYFPFIGFHRHIKLSESEFPKLGGLDVEYSNSILHQVLVLPLLYPL